MSLMPPSASTSPMYVLGVGALCRGPGEQQHYRGQLTRSIWLEDHGGPGSQSDDQVLW
jgi:hypothetical protein